MKTKISLKELIDLSSKLKLEVEEKTIPKNFSDICPRNFNALPIYPISQGDYSLMKLVQVMPHNETCYDLKFVRIDSTKEDATEYYEANSYNRKEIEEALIEINSLIQETNPKITVWHDGKEYSITKLLLRRAFLNRETDIIQTNVKYQRHVSKIEETKKVSTLNPFLVYDSEQFAEQKNRIQEEVAEINALIEKANREHFVEIDTDFLEAWQ